MFEFLLASEQMFEHVSITIYCPGQSASYTHTTKHSIDISSFTFEQEQNRVTTNMSEEEWSSLAIERLHLHFGIFIFMAVILGIACVCCSVYCSSNNPSSYEIDETHPRTYENHKTYPVKQREQRRLSRVVQEISSQSKAYNIDSNKIFC